MFPVRLSMVSYNIWNNERWPERAPALENFLRLVDPDVLCLQELHSQTQAFLDRLLSGHARVEDPLAGWTVEGNIYWKRALLEELQHGAEDAMHPEKDRRLFWVRLRVKATGESVFVSTAHLSSPTKEEESQTGVSPRVGQLRRICEALGRLVRAGEPAFFMGDMNDARHPQRILKGAGFVSCFSALGMQSPPTFKCFPTAHFAAGEPSTTEAIDLVAANARARAVCAAVPQIHCGDLAPSDHWPVHAVYELPTKS
jgi:endonuclease/exonuclease/phosphatase family metal-dependent hydrolase